MKLRSTLLILALAWPGYALADEPSKQAQSLSPITIYRHGEADTISLRDNRLLEARTIDAPSFEQHRDLKDVLTAIAASEVKTLVVFDIDDTILTIPEFFGSDSWYEWQKTIKPDPQGKLPEGYVPCTFDVLAINQEAARQNLTQPDATTIFNSITGDKIMVTSRNPATRGATERELTVRPPGEVPVELPAHLAPGVEAGWIYTSTAQEDRVVEVSYHHGIFMVNGTNKGLALLDLLKRLKKAYGFDPGYRRVILVDDGEKNHANMGTELAKAGIEFVPVWYTRVEKMKATAENKQSSAASWASLSEFWSQSFPARYASIKTQKRCHYGGLIRGELQE
jgi:hypothetical protein